MKQEVIYISGPMTGLPDYNYPEFFRVAELLESKGYKVINPAKIGVREGWNWKDYMVVNMIDLLTNDVTTIVTLNGWENSKGAKLEVHIGNELQMRVVSLEDFLSEVVVFKDADNIYLKDVKRPTFIYDKTTFGRVLYGDFTDIEVRYTEMRASFLSQGYKDNADALVLMEVPAKQELVDKLFNSTLFFNNYVKEIEEGQKK